MIDWRSDYRLGIPEIDGEHLVLFSLLNQIEINIGVNRVDECVEDILTSLLSYTKFHFTHEESRMTAAGYPAYEAHRKQHLAFMSQVTEMKSALPANYAGAQRIRLFIYDWLMNHIFETDALFARFTQQQEKSA